MRMRDQHQRDVDHLLHGYTNLSGHRNAGPVVITHGKGIRVFDDSGKEYIEAASGMWCTTFGFDEEELVEAATRQMRKMPYYHTLASRSLDPTIDLAERLASAAPISDPHIYLALSGSEANDFLIKFLWYYNNAVGRPRKKKVISRINSYHGATAVATSLTGVVQNHGGFDLPLPGFLRAEEPHYYRNSAPGESEEEYATRLANDLDQQIIREGPDTVMAFIAEPCTGAGGVVIPPPTYHQKVQAVLRKHDVHFLADEVITGMGRTGDLFGCQTLDIEPDTITLAKGLSSAYQPIAALVLSDEIYRGLVAGSDQQGAYFAHGATYSGHPVGAAVALRVLELIEERDMLAHVKRVSQHFARRLRAFADHPLVGDIRSVGLLGAVELVADRATRRGFEPEGSVAKHLKAQAESDGLIVRAVPCGDAIAFAPPLIITETEIDEVFDRFTKSLDATAEWVGARESVFAVSPTG